MSDDLRSTMAEKRAGFAQWRRERPFWGGTLLTLSGLLIGIIPLDLAIKFAAVPSEWAFVGLIFASLVLLCGIFAMVQPVFSEFFGAAGILLAIASIFGALGGFIIGTVLGIIGGSLCIAWVPPSEVPETEESSSDDESLLSSLRPS